MFKSLRNLFILLIISSGAFAQELQCKVTLNYSQLQSNAAAEKEVFLEAEKAIDEFINGQKWSNDIFRPNEKIKCNLSINLVRSSGQYQYSGNARFQVIRPVYGTSYETVVFNFVDRSFDFSFAPENRQMIFSEQNFNSNLTSMLAFYALSALTIDYDSFAMQGGNPFIDRLFNVVNLAGNSIGGAWDSKADTRDRYWVMENLRSQQFSKFRNEFYNYHRQGLDKITTEPEAARKVMLGTLEEIENLNTLRPNATLINLFFDAKAEEIVNIFSEAGKKERETVFKICSGISPDKTELFRQLVR